MSHRVYTTPGFIVESRPYREAGKILSIFTREFGMVNAAAEGIRLSQSKLRYHAQDFSLAEFSLVRGRDLWRVVGAEEKVSDSDTISSHSDKSLDPLFIRTLTVVRRLVHGEEKNEKLFDTVLAAHDFLTGDSLMGGVLQDEVDKKNTAVRSAEPIIMLRLLYHLGYIQTRPEIAPFLADNSFSAELLKKMSISSVASIAIGEINKALRESHL